MTIGKYPNSGGGTLTPGSVGTTELADSSVTTAKVADGAILNADVNASAAIAVSKLAAVTASRALVSDGSGFVSPATTTATEIGYVNGVTSAIQTQLTAKAADSAVVKLTGTQTIAGSKTFTDPVEADTLFIGTTGLAGSLNIADGIGKYSNVIQPAIPGTNLVLSLPTTAGSANNALVTDGSGNLSWAARVPTNGALGTPTSGTLTNCTGTAAGLTAGAVTTNANLTGDVTSVGNATTLTNAPVIAKVLTGYTSGAGTISATDSILSAIQKLNGNNATNANLTGPITSVGNATSIASQTGTGTKFVVDTSPTLITPILGTPTSGTLTNCTGLPQTGIGATVYVLADTPTSTITGSETDLKTWTVRTDTNSAFSAANGTFTAPNAGIYQFNLSLIESGTYTLNTNVQVGIYKNNVAQYYSFEYAGGVITAQAIALNTSLSLALNDVVKFKVLNTATSPGYAGGATFNWLTITKIGN